MTTQIDAMRKLSKKSTKDLKARYAKATGKSAEGWTRDSLVKELAMLETASQDAPTTTEPAAESAAPAPETTTEDVPPPATTIEYDEPNDPQPEESQDAAPDAAPEDTQMRSTKSKSKKSKAKAHRPPKPKAERKPKAIKAPKPAATPGERKPRLNGCAPGDTIERLYKGETHKVQVTDGGFKYGGELYSSLTAVAMKITNAKAISGRAFFKLWTKRGD